MTLMPPSLIIELAFIISREPAGDYFISDYFDTGRFSPSEDYTPFIIYFISPTTLSPPFIYRAIYASIYAHLLAAIYFF